MAKQEKVIEDLLRRAEAKFGFRYAVELHHALATGTPNSRDLLRKVLAA